MKVLGNLKMWQKLALVCTLFCVPVAALLFLLVSEKNIAIRFAAKELKGTQYLRPVRQLLELVPDHGRLAELAARGDTSVGPEAERSRVRVEEALTAIEQSEGRLGADLGTPEKAAALRRRWQEARPSTSPEGVQATHTALVSDLRMLIGQVGDGSNLILDPDLDSFYVMDAILLKIPEAVSLLAQFANLEEGVAARGAHTAEEKTQAVVLAGLLPSAAGGLETDSEVAFRKSPAGNLKPALERPLGEALNGLNGALNRAEARLAGAGGQTEAGPELPQELGRARSAVLALWDAATPQLDELLSARIAGFQKRKAASLGVVGTCLLLCGVLVWTIVHSIAGSLSQGVEFASAIAAGRIDARLGDRDLVNRDEVGQLMNALDRMSASLFGFLQQVELSSSALAASSAQLSCSAPSIARGADEQSARSDQVSTAATEMSATIQEVAPTPRTWPRRPAKRPGWRPGGATSWPEPWTACTALPPP